MRLGFFSRLLDDVPPGERYRLAAEQIRHAEAAGFDSAWVAQHHFDGTEGGLPAPLVFLAHVAARDQPRSGSARASSRCRSNTRSGWPRTPRCSTC